MCATSYADIAMVCIETAAKPPQPPHKNLQIGMRSKKARKKKLLHEMSTLCQPFASNNGGFPHPPRPALSAARSAALRRYCCA